MSCGDCDWGCMQVEAGQSCGLKMSYCEKHYLDAIQRAQKAEGRVAELESAVKRCLATADDVGLLEWDGCAILQGVVHDRIPAPARRDGEERALAPCASCGAADETPRTHAPSNHVRCLDSAMCALRVEQRRARVAPLMESKQRTSDAPPTREEGRPRARRGS